MNTTSTTPINLSFVVNRFAPDYHYVVESVTPEFGTTCFDANAEVLELQLSDSKSCIKLWKYVDRQPQFIKPCDLLLGEVCGYIHSQATLDELKEFIDTGIVLTMGFFTRVL